MSNSESAPDAPLRPTTKIKAIDGPGYVGRLGFLIREDAVGNIVAFTAAQIGGKEVQSVESQRVVARMPNWVTSESSGDDERPADTMLTPLNVDSMSRLADVQVRDADGQPLYPTDVERDLVHLLGQSVLVHTGSDRALRARVMGTRGHFLMPAVGRDDLTLFTDALVLERDDGHPVSQEGDAGALVTTETGAAVGIVICGVKGTSFAAPLAAKVESFLDHRGSFTGLSREFIAKRNANLAPTETVHENTRKRQAYVMNPDFEKKFEAVVLEGDEKEDIITIEFLQQAKGLLR